MAVVRLCTGTFGRALHAVTRCLRPPRTEAAQHHTSLTHALGCSASDVLVTVGTRTPPTTATARTVPTVTMRTVRVAVDHNSTRGRVTATAVCELPKPSRLAS